MDHGENAYWFVPGIYWQTVPALVNHPGNTSFFMSIWSTKGFLQCERNAVDWTDVGSCAFNTLHGCPPLQRMGFDFMTPVLCSYTTEEPMHWSVFGSIIFSKTLFLTLQGTPAKTLITTGETWEVQEAPVWACLKCMPSVCLRYFKAENFSPPDCGCGL